MFANAGSSGGGGGGSKGSSGKAEDPEKEELKRRQKLQNSLEQEFSMRKTINELGEQFHILEIGVDRWNATQLITDLEGDGFTMVPIGMGFKDMSPGMKELYKLLLEGKVNHGGNPVLRWMAGNVVAEVDAAENIKPSKKKSTEKIDGIVALIMAIDRAVRHAQGGSVYDRDDYELQVF